jgi:hypothetical protein
MPRARVWPVTGFQGVSLTPLSRVYFNGLPITQEGIAGVTYAVREFNDGSPSPTVNKVPLNVDTTVFDAFEGNLPGSPDNPDPRWKLDLIGYNFGPTIPPTCFPTADEYWVIFIFTPTSGSPFVEICRATILSNMVGTLP